jgi:hypothetical protein
MLVRRIFNGFFPAVSAAGETLLRGEARGEGYGELFLESGMEK